MKPAIEWLNELAETFSKSMFSGKQPPGVEVEQLIERIQADAKSECPASEEEQCEFDLKPCPFCGGAATLRRTVEGGVFVDCDDCSASSKMVFGDKTDARPLIIEAWNERHSGLCPTCEGRGVQTTSGDACGLCGGSGAV